MNLNGEKGENPEPLAPVTDATGTFGYLSRTLSAPQREAQMIPDAEAVFEVRDPGRDGCNNESGNKAWSVKSSPSPQ